MRLRLWGALAITYILVVSWFLLISHFMNRMLQSSQMDEYIIDGVLILLATVGMVIGIKIGLAKRKK